MTLETALGALPPSSRRAYDLASSFRSSKMTFHARSDSLCVRRPPAICDSDIIKEVEGLVQDVAEFATNLAQDLADFIDSLPTPSKLMRMAVDFVKEKLLSGDGLCVRPNCGGHVNSGTEQNLRPGSYGEPGSCWC